MAELLYEIAHLHLSSSRRVCHAASPGDLTSESLTGRALSMALASAYAVSGLSQEELCSSNYGTKFREQPLQFLPLAEFVPGDFLLDPWVWCAAATPPTQSGSEKVRGKVLNVLFG